MLTPEQMDNAGELVAAAYRQVEAEMLEYLVAKMIEGDVAGQRAQTAILLLSQTMPLELQKIIDAHAGEIDAAVRKDVERSLRASDTFDLAAISDGLGVSLAADALAVQTLTVAASVRGVLARDNLEMTAAARSKFVQWSTWAATQTGTGAMTPAHALHKAVRELARGGITMVSYRDPETGNPTVTNRADVAVQRHIRTLIAQGAAQLTLQRVGECGCGFVEVSSHIGARPSHAAWHGRVYHVGGAIDYEGEHYEDFEFGTGYGGTCGPYTDLGDQLLGVNCHHSFGPWVPGSPRAYGPDPEHPSGLNNDTVYELTQEQRERERGIRSTKRELAAAQQLYDAEPSTENQVEVAKLKAKLRDQQAGMREFIKETNAKGKPGTEVLVRQPLREWAGDMPKGALDVPAPSMRKVDDVLAMPSAAQRMASAGVSKAALKKQIASDLAADGMTSRGFQYLTAKQQSDILSAALAKLKALKGKATGAAKASGGAHAATAQNIAAKMQGKGLEDAHVQGIASIAEKCADADASRAFAGGLGELRFDTTKARGGDAWYSPASHGLTLNMDATARGFAHRPDKAPFQTFFHEYGHYLDHRAEAFAYETVGRRKFGKNASHVAGLGATAEKEVRDLLGEIKRREGYGSISEAKAHLTREIEALYQSDKGTLGGLADIIHGATNGSCCDSWMLPKHRKSYWVRKNGGMRNLSTETFAHFFETTMANPAALETLKKYLPATYNVFKDVLKGMQP